jgi:hypothetical protein
MCKKSAQTYILSIKGRKYQGKRGHTVTLPLKIRLFHYLQVNKEIEPEFHKVFDFWEVLCKAYA